MHSFEVMAIVFGNPVGFAIKANSHGEASAKAKAKYPTAKHIAVTRIDAIMPHLKQLQETLARQKFYGGIDWKSEIETTQNQIAGMNGYVQ